ncbi:MAG: diaminopimelate decarboxylase family protein [Desulfuromonadaceae bacterium]
MVIYDVLKNYFVTKSINIQKKHSILSDLSLWGLCINERGRITVRGEEVDKMTKKFGSPLMVVNKDRLIVDAQSIQSAIEQVGRSSKVLYSYKTNCTPGILNELHNIGIGAEVISPYELWLAEKLHVPGDSVIYNGVDKTEDSLVRAIEMRILSINIDSLEEIERIAAVSSRLKRKARIGIRLGFVAKAQFGLEIDSGEAMEACRRIAHLSDCLELTCIHFCVVSNARNSASHSNYAGKALEFMCSVKQQTGLEVRYLDLGGGIGVPTTKNMSGLEYGLYRLFGCLPSPPEPQDYEEIGSFVGNIDAFVKKKCLKLNLEPPGLILEPGRYVTSRAQFLLSTVLSIKEKTGGVKFAITDAGRLSTSFPCDFELHEMFLADQTAKNNMEVYNVMGRICTSADWMMKNRLLPELQQGDVLVTMDAGAYFSSYSTNFAFPRPAVVMVSDAGSELLRKEESFEHLTLLDACM